LEKRAKTDGSGRIRSRRSEKNFLVSKILGFCLLAVGCILGIIAGNTGVISAKADDEVKMHQFMYTVKVEYKDQKATLQFTMEDLNDTSKGYSYVGAKVYLYDIFLKEYADLSNGGAWQENVDFRQAKLIYATEANFGMGDVPYAEADITDVYNNTDAFKKINTESVTCEKKVTDTQVTFSGSTYFESYNFSVIPNDIADDDESRYLYLEGKSSGEAKKSYRYKIEEGLMPMRVVSAEYMINRDNNWKECENAYRYYTEMCADFEFSDYNVGDIISYRVKYENGRYSAVSEHKITDLNVDVDPNGGSLNGNTTVYQRFSDGSNGSDVQIAIDYERVDKFPSIVCEREGYTFQGFEFVEGEGEIVEIVKYGYMAYLNFTYVDTGEKGQQKIRVSDSVAYKYSSPEALREYLWKSLCVANGEDFSFTKDDIEIHSQRRVFYYVRSDMSYVKVRAVWKSDKAERKISLIKLASSMYNSSLFRRSDGDDSWFSASKRLELGKTNGGVGNLLHVRITPDGRIAFV
jgi:hypothetical protein